MRLDDLVRHIRGASHDGILVEILERADRILAADGGRECTRGADRRGDRLATCRR